MAKARVRKKKQDAMDEWAEAYFCAVTDYIKARDAVMCLEQIYHNEVSFAALRDKAIKVARDLEKAADARIEAVKAWQP